MAKLLNEAFVVSKGKDHRDNPIAFIDPKKPENKETFKHKDAFKSNGAKWDGKNKVWYWYIGKTKDQWKNVFDTRIKPALQAAHGAEGASPEESDESIVASLDALMGEVDEMISSPSGEKDGKKVITPQEKDQIKDRLAKFKETLVNLDDDEEFKKTMQAITAFKNAQGHKYSLRNTILIMIQNPSAKFVMSEPRWHNYNRTVNEEAKDPKNGKVIWVVSPKKGAMRQYSRQQKEAITQDFLKSVGKQRVEQLGIGEKDRLNVMLRGFLTRGQFEETAAYDIADTTQMEGKEDHTTDLTKKQEIKWFEENMLSDEVKPIYTAVMNVANQKGIDVQLVDPEKLGGARGMSMSGKIQLLKSEGNDVGITKTLVHETAHELLHQRYLHGKDPEMRKYFKGTSEGRGVVEQQAELTAWMVMASYGFDLKTTSLNYVAIWGADKDQMVRVFDTVSDVTNYLLDQINAEIAKGDTNEGLTEAEGGELTPARHISPEDIAKVLGVEQEYNKEVQQDGIVEHFYKLSGGKQIL